MSQVTQPRFHVPTSTPSRTTALVAGLLALAGTVAVVLILALGGSSSTNTGGATASPARPALRSDGGPEEGSVALRVAARPVPGPSESAVAAAIGTRQTPLPDESSVAASIRSGAPTH
jgi:hypothetical protein